MSLLTDISSDNITANATGNIPTKAAKNPPDTKYGHSDLFNFITRENEAGSMFSSSSSSPGFFT